MVISSKEEVKNFVAEALYRLMLEKKFNKISVMQICDKAGINRSTFYNYFYDKYDALEYLIVSLLNENKKDENLNDYLKSVMMTINEHKIFFSEAVNIDEHNGFYYIMEKNLKVNIKKFISVKQECAEFANDFLCDYVLKTIILAIKLWMTSYFEMDYDEAMDVFKHIYYNSIRTMI